MTAAAATFSLTRFLEDVRVVAPQPGRAFEVDWLPTGRTLLLYRVLEEGRRGEVSLAGPRTRAHFKSSTGFTRAVVLQFKPGWSATLFGVAATELTDRQASLQDLWGHAGAEACLEQLLATRSVPEALDRLSQAIATHTKTTFESASAHLVRRAVRLLEGDAVRVESVARQLGVTGRHLRRAFVHNVGVGPKEFARTVRLQRAVRRASTSKDWAHIASVAGYYDQSHLIADFRELVGLTPGAYLKRQAERRSAEGAANRGGRYL